ncbi:MAG: Holliday junction branch migration protein RuvA [Armatimonadota bacterium]|nr:Holliday junction branch migration protein RuvA [Armatimonadota bacterium]
MIRYLRGELVSVDEDSAIVDVAGIGYEVNVSPPFADRLRRKGAGAQVTIHTYHTERGGAAGSGTPMLVGFESKLERSFFEELLTVPQLGPVGACKAMALPISTIAKAISVGDESALKRLPGVGKQRARDMISKLQESMGPYLAADEELPERGPADELTAEALAILTQLGLSQSEALKRVQAVRDAEPEIDEVDELVRAVFRRK